jgi:hypothetical protein
MIDVSDIIFKFRNFLLLSWTYLLELDDDDITKSFQENFIEVIWELIMQTFLFTKIKTDVIIQCYYNGEGIEFYSYSNRAFCPDREVTHEIFCLPKKGEYVFDFLNATNISLTANDDFEFDRLVGRSEDPLLTYLFQLLK